jgi:flagellar hook-associated protein 2
MASVDGLVTGLDTTTIINQLMQIEAQSQTRLRTKVSDHQTVQNAYQVVNARMVAVRTAAEALTSTTTWQAVRATSSNTAVTATASTAAATGSVTFDISKLASGHVVTSQAPVSGSLTTGGTVDLTIGGRTTTVTVRTDTAQGVADAVNAAKLGVRASVLSTTGGQVLQFASATTGAAQAFTVAGLTAPATVLTAAADAELTVGDPAAGGYRMTSADNTFRGLLPGVTIKAGAVAEGVTVATTSDADAIATAVAGLVTAINNTISQIDSGSTYNTTTNTGGPLTGNGLTRGLRQQLLSGVSQGIADYGSLSGFGVKLDRSGSLVFDRAAFLSAYAADPAGVQDAVSTGFAETYRGLAEDMTDPTSGKLTAAVQGGETALRRLNKEIDDWDTRLEARRESLQRKYANLEVALGRLQDQSSWLSGQLASLTSSSS